jgi:hypothetical protein
MPEILAKVVLTAPVGIIDGVGFVKEMHPYLGQWIYSNEYYHPNKWIVKCYEQNWCFHNTWLQTYQQMFDNVSKVQLVVTDEIPCHMLTVLANSLKQQLLKESLNGSIFTVKSIADFPDPGLICDSPNNGPPWRLPPQWLLIEDRKTIEPEEMDTDAFLKKQRDEIFRKMFAEK